MHDRRQGSLFTVTENVEPPIISPPPSHYVLILLILSTPFSNCKASSLFFKNQPAQILLFPSYTDLGDLQLTCDAFLFLLVS